MLETQFHRRLAEPWTCLVAVLIALPFGASTNSRRNVLVGVASRIPWLIFSLPAGVIIPANGLVEIEAEGDRDAMERFERAVRQGPAGSRVESVDVVVHAVASLAKTSFRPQS